MVFKDKVSIITESKVSDGMGGYTVDKDTVCTIKCKVAPYNVTEHDVLHIAKPWSSVNFYTKDDIIETIGDEDAEFFLEYNGKTYKKVLIIDYGKCIKIVGERYHENNSRCRFIKF